MRTKGNTPSRTRATLAAGVLAAALAIAGCGGGGGSPVQSGRTPQNLTVGVGQIPDTLDPGQNFYRAQYSIMQLVEGTLTEQNPDGESVSMGLAQKLQQHGRNQYVATLRRGLRFSDGKPLTAHDVEATFSFLLGDKKNGFAYTFAPIRSVHATGARTVVFDLKRPYPSLPFVLALPTSGIIPAGALSDPKKVYAGDPLPTAGPYRVASFERNEMTLQRNPHYWGQPHHVKQILFKRITDPTARLAQVQGGQIDYADDIGPNLAKQISAPVQARDVVGINGGSYLSLNNRGSGPLSDARVRKAIAYAVDRKKINQVAYGGRNQPLRGLWANASRFSQPFLPATPDVAKAKALLQGTQCQNGCKLSILARADNEVFTDTALVVQQNLKAIGIQASIERVDAPTQGSREGSGNFDIAADGLYDVADFPDGILGFGLDPKGGIHAYYTGYDSPRIRPLIDAVDTSQGAARLAAVKRLNALFARDMPFVPLTGYFVVGAARVPANVFRVDPTLYYHVG